MNTTVITSYILHVERKEQWNNNDAGMGGCLPCQLTCVSLNSLGSGDKISTLVFWVWILLRFVLSSDWLEDYDQSDNTWRYCQGNGIAVWMTILTKYCHGKGLSSGNHSIPTVKVTIGRDLRQLPDGCADSYFGRQLVVFSFPARCRAHNNLKPWSYVPYDVKSALCKFC